MFGGVAATAGIDSPAAKEGPQQYRRLRLGAAAACREGTVHAGAFRLLVRELVVVLELTLQAGELLFESGHGRLLGGIGVTHCGSSSGSFTRSNSSHWSPSSKSKSACGSGSHTVVRAGVVVSGVVVVAIIQARAPVLRGLAVEEGNEAPALHVGGTFSPARSMKVGAEVRVDDEGVLDAARTDLSGPPHEERHAQRGHT